ncbi:MAG: bifunctional demethylmenaquinone methyltransferase/2-methoxy-6-polyprenyl-1,4-benzoquinol methylase UbiE [Candidatus Zixiibacteriota bacterium]
MNDSHGRKIESMFDRISPRYDFLNRLLSGFNDMRWRKKAVAMIGDVSGKAVLDLCCGSGDFMLIFDKKYGDTISIHGADFAAKMLVIAGQRLQNKTKSHILLTRADAQELPFADASIEAVTIGFGIRNVTDKPKALRDIHRILSPGGRLAIIEPAIPKNPIVRFLFSLYFGKIMPLIGGLISGNYQAYKYLNDSVEAFPSPDKFCKMIRDAGFAQAKGHPQFLETATIFLATK